MRSMGDLPTTLRAHRDVASATKSRTLQPMDQERWYGHEEASGCGCVGFRVVSDGVSGNGTTGFSPHRGRGRAFGPRTIGVRGHVPARIRYDGCFGVG